jgi:hypothetical protein
LTPYISVGLSQPLQNICGDCNVGGDHSYSTVIKQQSADAAAIAQAFADFYAAVQQQPDLPQQDKADVQAELEEVETELQKAEEANEGFIRRRLRHGARYLRRRHRHLRQSHCWTGPGRQEDRGEVEGGSCVTAMSKSR